MQLEAIHVCDMFCVKGSGYSNSLQKYLADI